MYCNQCGTNHEDNARFCRACGRAFITPINAIQMQPVSTTYQQSNTLIIEQLSNKEKIAGIIWLVIGCLQILIGLDWPIIILGIWNIIAAIMRFSRSKKILHPYPGLVDEYKRWLAVIIITLIFNVILGAYIGVAGCIYDFTIRHFALTNKDEIDAIIRNKAGSDANLRLYSSSFFMYEKKDSATALSCGLPDRENDCVTPKSLRSLWNANEIY